jgi:hypothetical protein
METAASPELSGHVFMCYAKEDEERVAALERILVASRILVWRSTSSLGPGDEWRPRIRNAIQNDSLAFLACFSSRSIARRSSYQNVELLLAVDELRSRRPDNPWLIPVRLDDCQIPKLDIGGGRTLSDLQWTDLFGPDCKQNTGQLVAKIAQICRPAEELAEPPAEPPADASRASTPGWMATVDAFDQTYQRCIGWVGTMISPVAMSAVLHLGTDPGVAAAYLSHVPVRKAARMLAASPPAVAGQVLKQMKDNRARVILNHIPADTAQAIVDTM